MKLGIVVLLCACGPQWIVTKPVAVPAKPGALDKAVALLIADGESIETKDEAAGALVTKWTQVEQMSGPVQTRITVTVAGEQVIVASQCQRPTIRGPLTTTTGWEPCGDRQLETQQAKVDRIAAGLR